MQPLFFIFLLLSPCTTNQFPLQIAAEELGMLNKAAPLQRSTTSQSIYYYDYYRNKIRDPRALRQHLKRSLEKTVNPPL
uniref:Putative secreted protein n=1 Tax=Ixodes ricinus TaxID=34613 RepID=A0A090X9A8_IXORI